MLIRHKAKDFDKWKPAFDENAAVHEKRAILYFGMPEILQRTAEVNG